MEQCFGASVTSAGGFACNPGTGLQVIVQPGQVTTPGTVDDSSYGSLPAISSLLPRSHIMRDQMALTVPGAGATYSVYAAISQIDGGSVVVSYYNPANPAQTLGGINNSGTAQPTVRQDLAGVVIGTSVPAGGIPLWTITVPAGATSITAAMIMQASTAPVFPTIPQLVSGRMIGKPRTYASTQTYVQSSASVATVFVRAWGGGGSGAGAAATGAGQVSAGSGGGAGGYFEKTFAIATAAGATINIGTGGSTASVGAAGNDGQATSFLSCTAPGGKGGSYNQPNTNTVIYPTGGASGGVATGGDVNGVGGTGGYAFYATTASSGAGGASTLGSGGQAITGSGNGAAGVTPGSGGSGGAQSVASSAGATGGAGAPGLIIITEYS